MKRPIVFVLMTLLMLLPALVVAKTGKFITIDPPGAIITAAFAINPAGAITGIYVDEDFERHGFLRAPGGKFTTFDAPQDSSFLNPTGINPEGVITGYYSDASGVAHGFLRIP